MPTKQHPALPILSSVVLGVLASQATAQATPQANAPTPAGNGLPTFLIQVPAGQVWVGLSAERLIEVCAETVPPYDPKRLDPKNPNYLKALQNTLSELGRSREQVATFYLAKWQVTNKEYRAFAEKNKARIPYHWWRYGRKDDYEKRLEEINKAFPQDGPMAAVYYWERHWAELPYELKDENGNSIEEQPVRFVSWRDAMRCAGWLGMRLPTEVEWTRAARGDGEHAWIWGAAQGFPGGDHYGEKALEAMVLKNYRDQKLKKPGEVKIAIGPYGHFDMAGQVWEWTATREFKPLAGEKAFQDEWTKFVKNKLTPSEGMIPPLWNDSRVIVKGGSYLSAGDPVQLHIDARIAIPTTETVDSVGFRLAKTPKPGYDALFSLIKGGDFDQRAFGLEQEVNLADQVGIERYKFGATGFPEAYHMVSAAPVNFLTRDKGMDLKKLQEATQTGTLLLVGTIATTEKVASPTLEPGIYSVLFRQKGMPRELTDALKAGFKQVQADLKRKTEKPADEKPEEWRAVLTKFGIDAKELEDKEALEKIKFVRINGVAVNTESSSILFTNNEGAIVAALPVKHDLAVTTTYAGSTVELDATPEKEGGKQRVTIKLGMPIEQRNARRLTEVTIPLVLDQTPPTDATWLLPTGTAPANGAGGAGGSNNAKK